MALKAFYKAGIVEAGCDEAGRGCLAGPVYAAAVILPADYFHPFLNDSKQLIELQRDQLREEIEKEAVSYAVASVSAAEIDEINILNASYLAMHRALDQLDPLPAHILIDGNRFRPYKDIPGTCVIKGDGLYFSIAAASVLAKTYRDEFMRKIHNEFPHYNWKNNKGYPTREHREGIKKYGACSWHRKTFQLLNNQLEIDFC
jgi:ribonuclease HII